MDRPMTPGELSAYRMGQRRGLVIAAEVMHTYAQKWNLSGDELEHFNAMRDGISQAVNLLELNWPVQN